eukprot:363785-Chlamydomonas_euryale.AAC.6
MAGGSLDGVAGGKLDGVAGETRPNPGYVRREAAPRVRQAQDATWGAKETFLQAAGVSLWRQAGAWYGAGLLG